MTKFEWCTIPPETIQRTLNALLQCDQEFSDTPSPKEPDMQLYQYAVVKPAQPNNDARLIVPPSEWALYPSAEAAKAAAIREIPGDFMQNFASSWVLVRPFC